MIVESTFMRFLHILHGYGIINVIPFTDPNNSMPYQRIVPGSRSVREVRYGA